MKRERSLSLSTTKLNTHERKKKTKLYKGHSAAPIYVVKG